MNNPFKYNPFSGILAEDLESIIVPKFDSDEVVSRINSAESLAIEFIGRQGRGKSTHLTYLQQQLVDCPIFLLNADSSFRDIVSDKSPVVFVDSIHHLNLLERVKLLKEKRVVIYTTHWPRTLDCYLAKKPKHTIKFKGINKETLTAIINRRLEIASFEHAEYERITTNEATTLIKSYGDNYRGIINHLYERYQ
ncbi:MAG: hypothetical protein AB8F78_02015 [Saprospiraceae bacterium]